MPPSFGARFALLFVLGGSSLAACGGDRPSASEAFCDALRPVGELDRETEQTLAGAGNWSETQRVLVSALRRVDAAYAKAATSAPASLREPVTVLQRFTAGTVMQAQTASSAEAFRASVLADRRTAVAAGEASRVIDAHTRAECGFSINNEQ